MSAIINGVAVVPLAFVTIVDQPRQPNYAVISPMPFIVCEDFMILVIPRGCFYWLPLAHCTILPDMPAAVRLAISAS